MAVTGALLRIYDPAECSTDGVPLDWEHCRRCDGRGKDPTWVCMICGGHGSLKAAALASRLMRFRGAAAIPAAEIGHRCESCSHPMSEGTWEGEFGDDILRADLLRKRDDDLRCWSERNGLVHYSPCDGRCRHGGPGRYEEPARLSPRPFWRGWAAGPTGGEAATMVALDNRAEASWRQVDVRTLGWAADLRPEKLAVLCLRCWAVL